MEVDSREWRWSACRLVLLALCGSPVLWPRASAQPGLQTVTGLLYAENFTYYKLNGEGWLRLELHSVTGDVDLYVSDASLHPSYDSFTLKSETCGIDVVDIHSDMARPIGIAIYAHPFYFQSAYKLDITVVSETELDEYEQLFRRFHYFDHVYEDESYNDDYNSFVGKSKRNSAFQDSPPEEEESIWWEILMTVLKFILEIIV